MGRNCSATSGQLRSFPGSPGLLSGTRGELSEKLIISAILGHAKDTAIGEHKHVVGRSGTSNDLSHSQHFRDFQIRGRLQKRTTIADIRSRRYQTLTRTDPFRRAMLMGWSFLNQHPHPSSGELSETTTPRLTTGRILGGFDWAWRGFNWAWCDFGKYVGGFDLLRRARRNLG